MTGILLIGFLSLINSVKQWDFQPYFSQKINKRGGYQFYVI